MKKLCGRYVNDTDLLLHWYALISIQGLQIYPLLPLLMMLSCTVSSMFLRSWYTNWSWSLLIKSCGLDPMPTPLMKLFLLELVPVITKVIYFSLCSSIIPDTFKHATATPLLTKAGLDINEFFKYRLVSNLPFLFKVQGKKLIYYS